MSGKRLGKRLRTGPLPEKRFDMEREPVEQKKYLMPIVWGFSYIRKWLHRGKLNKVRMEGVKPPYILLCNHNSFYDFYIMSAALAPQRGFFPAAVDDYIGREEILRKLGTIPKRKYTADISLLRQCRKVLKSGSIFGIYVEARYSMCGSTEVIPDAVGQLIKHSGVPVVTLKMSGHHIYNPFWNIASHRFFFPVEATMTQLYTVDEIKKATPDEINQKVREALYNDDFRWQSENRKKLKYKKRAEGLHKVLYQCPHCKAEYDMDSKGAKVFCRNCGKSWTLNYYGELEADNGETEFKFPTDWYAWEREQVRAEVESGNYRFESEVDVNDLPNSKGYVRLGSGKIIHDMNGFSVKGVRDYDGKPFEMNIPALSQYACHVEFKYRYGQYRDCIDLNTLENTWYVFPKNCKFSVAKVALATEEIFNKLLRDKEKAAVTSDEK